jgi:HAMP domain-containing protein
LAITQYRTPITQTAILSQPTTSFYRPKEWELKIYPISALQNQTERVRVSNDDTILNMLHIDYNRLNKLAESRNEQSLKSSISHPAISGSSIPDPKKQKEIDALKKEVEDLKESLRGQDKKLQELENQIYLEHP